MKLSILKYTSIAFILALCWSCKKSSFLNAKPNNALVVPSTLNDFQALLDNDIVMNGSSIRSIGGPIPALLTEGSDDYYIMNPDYSNFSLFSKNVYIWANDDVYGGETNMGDWAVPYRAIFYSNIALDGLQRIVRTGDNSKQWDNVEGSALFFRAVTFYELAQAFAPFYDKNTSSSQLGIPLRLTSDISEPSKRATLQQTYDQIINDLLKAKSLLPVAPLYKTRPSKTAIYALLARIYQTMEDYNNAKLYADSCLQLYSSLLDYNTFDSNSTNPFPIFNDEVIFASIINNYPYSELTASKVRIDSTLYNSYSADDLRKVLFFRLRSPGQYSFKGSYDGTSFLFGGIATDEIYLIRAECYARNGDLDSAMRDLNDLLQTRWKTGTYTPLTATDPNNALRQILTERRKELVMRGLRWTDLRRLNTDPRFAKTLKRVIDGKAYTLPPNDDRYTWPIPDDVIGFNQGMQQNQR